MQTLPGQIRRLVEEGESGRIPLETRIMCVLVRMHVVERQNADMKSVGMISLRQHLDWYLNYRSKRLGGPSAGRDDARNA